MSRSTPNTPRVGNPTPGEARSTLVNALREQRARDRSERGTLTRARWRQGVIFLLVVAALGALLLRTAYWQVDLQRTLADRADAQHLRAISLPTGRGEILDARGRLLALSVTEDTVIADPDVIRSERALDTTAQALANMLGLSKASVRGQLDVPGAYVRLRDADGQAVLATQAQSEAIGAAIGNGTLPGIALIPAVRRVYPTGGLAAQALGFVRVATALGSMASNSNCSPRLPARRVCSIRRWMRQATPWRQACVARPQLCRVRTSH
jgi:cell division protein FtsI/penicillin-binding protein 2